MAFSRVIFLSVLAIVSFTGGRTAIAAEYEIDLSHSFIQFKIQHLGFSWLIGRFNDFEGTFTYDPEGGSEAQRISVTIQTDSIDSNWADRDKHLRSDNFLDVETYPTATFVSTGYQGDESGGVMTGDLTLHGVTRPIEITVGKVGEGDDPWGGYRAGFSGTATLSRSDFGMEFYVGPNSDVMEMELFVEGVRQ